MSVIIPQLVAHQAGMQSSHSIEALKAAQIFLDNSHCPRSQDEDTRMMKTLVKNCEILLGASLISCNTAELL